MAAKSNKKRKLPERVSNSPSVKSGTFILKIALIIMVSLFIWLLIRLAHVQDDAFITFRYVKNFVAGNGLVFNIGERVEGYTNFLWAMILSGPALLHYDMVYIAPILSSFFGVFILIATYFISRLVIIEKTESNRHNLFPELFALVPVLLLASNGSFAYWAASGMETTFFIFCVLGAIYFYLRDKESEGTSYYTPALLALSALTRPEGIYFFAIVYLHKLLFLIINKSKSGPSEIAKKLFTKNNGLELSVFLVPVALHFAFRLIYYGYLFPNTYYAKSNFSFAGLFSGLEYAYSFLKAYLLFGALLIIPLITLRKRLFNFELSLFYMLILLYSLYVIGIGGDVLPLHRFWLPLLPLIFILFSVALLEIYCIVLNKGGLSTQRTKVAFLVFILGLAYYNYSANEPTITYLKQKEINLVEQLKDRAEIINGMQTLHKKKLTVAVSTIGAFSYYTDATVIDMLGLTDAYIAHNPEVIPEISNDASNPWKEKKYNSEYLLSRKPDYIVMATIVKPSSFAERALFTKREFFYNYFIQFIPATENRRYFFFAKKTRHQIDLANNEKLKNPVNPDYVRTYIRLAEYLSDYLVNTTPDRLQKVNNEFEHTKNIYPAFFADQYRLLGDAYFNANDFTTSAQYYDKSVAVDSLNVVAYLGLCSVYQRLNDKEQVNSCIEKIEHFQLADDIIIRNYSNN